MIVNPREEVKDFLRSRRARIAPTPQELSLDTRSRRVPGLRRDEVAARAAISLDYYIQLERGQTRGVSDQVLGSLMDALELDSVERRYLIDLVAQLNRAGGDEGAAELPDGVRAMVEAMAGVAAVLRNHRMDMLAGNQLGRALFRAVRGMPDHNIARHVFEDPASRRLYPDYDLVANFAAGTLRASLAAHLGDHALERLVEDLLQTEDFRHRWDEHHVLRVGSGMQRFDDPEVGPMELAHSQFQVRGEPHLVMTVYRPLEGSREQFEALARMEHDFVPGDRA